MSDRPPIDYAAADRAVARLLTGQPAVTRREPDSERSERRRRRPAASTASAGAAIGAGDRQPGADASAQSGPHKPAARASEGAGTADGAIVAPTGLGGPLRCDRLGTDAEARAWLAGRLGLGTAERIAAHVERCASCRARASALLSEGIGRPPLLETKRASFPKRDQLGTSFSTDAVDLDEAGAILAERLADDPRAHYFRREVARHLEPWWPRRAAALMSCGEAGARCDCGDCGSPHVLPYRCGARSCPTCARTASAIACERVAHRAELAASLHLDKWEGGTWVDKWGEVREGRPVGQYAPAWRMLTLTTRAAKTAAERYEPETLRRYALAVRRSWGKFWRGTAWGRRVRDVSAAGRPTKRARRDTLFAIGIEVAPGGMVHLHAAIYGERIEHAALLAAWKAACDVGGGVEVHLMRRRGGERMQGAADAEGFRDALREVLKYISKGDKEPGKRTERAAAVEYALRRIRRVELGGALRFVPKITEKDVATEQKKCEACGGAGSWKWRGMRAPAYVRRNGGFGVSHIVDDKDVEARRAEDTGARLEAQGAARELAAAEDRKRRPGGEFYGGSPPPWIDDGDEWETVSDREHSPPSLASAGA